MRGAWLTRFVFLRLLGFVCVAAFLSLIIQLDPLIGSNGLLPAAKFLDRLRQVSGFNPWLQLPTIFWFNCSDSFLMAMAALGLLLSLLLLGGLANGILLASIWVIYLSFVHIGQIFYGYGWEILLLETCFLGIFLVPWVDPRPFPKEPPAKAVIWLFWWLAFRIMFGAGLIKMRGDACWRDLSALCFHFETQPIPNPLSPFFHHLPALVLKAGVLWNHFVELVVPFFVLGPRRWRNLGGWLIISFQIFLILSGNLSFLNWLTIAACIPILDDGALAPLMPKRWVALAAERAQSPAPPGAARQTVIYLVTAFLVLLSIPPALNMASPRQIMNTSFEPLHLVNTYGAFGSVGRTRNEIILEGTDEATLGLGTKWKEYEFWAKPGDVRRMPPVIAPFQPRLDWQIWFAAMSTIDREPWLVSLIFKLLQNDRGVLRLMANNPFPDHPPTYIRAELYEYKFTRAGDRSGAWWERKRVDSYLRPVSLEDYLR